MTNDQYHSDRTAISKSGLDQIHKSPAHYYEVYLNPNRPPRKETEAFELGSVFHKIVLEPSDFKNEYVITPHDAPKRPTSLQINAKNPSADTEKQIAWWRNFDANIGLKKLIDQETYDVARRMRDSVMDHPAAGDLLSRNGYCEETIFFTEEITGVKCKCRPDKRLESQFILDLKSTEDASPDGFGRSSYNYRYHVQAPFYLYGAEQVFGGYDTFVFIACEKTPPYAVGVYFATREILSLGLDEFTQDLATYKECLRTNEWPAYSPIIEPLKLPGWAFKKVNN